jgi:imidazolonepropionase-like amidohydrolase
MERIDAVQLVRGDGPVLENATVVLDGPSIAFVGSTAALPAHFRNICASSAHTVMPGLWDAHCHFHGIRRFSLEDMLLTPKPTAAARAAKEAESALQAGITSVREAGGLGIWLQAAIDEGTIAGPTIYSAGSVLSQSGGHADVHSVPHAWVADNCESGHFLHLCDGVPECLKAVRLQLRKNARVIKVCASGGITSTVDDPIHQQFSMAELRAIVDEAARADRVVMAHCHGKPGIMAALEAGVKTIEHGSYLDAEAASLMAEVGAILVPTRYIIDRMLQQLDQIPQHAARKIQIVADRHLEAIGHALDAGVILAAGTDIGTTGQDTLLPWGRNGSEAALLHAAGLTVSQSIAAITANAPLTLGPQAPKSGVLAAGYDADVIALDVNPLDDLRYLGQPDHITDVWKLGQRAKAAGIPVVHIQEEASA